MVDPNATSYFIAGFKHSGTIALVILPSHFSKSPHWAKEKNSERTPKHDKLKTVCMVNVTKINVQEFLDACFGYLETLIVQEYHHLRYMGYNSLYECNMNFYILYGPLMFVNASESSSFALQAPSTDGDRRHMVSMKLLARDFNSNTLFSKGNIFFHRNNTVRCMQSNMEWPTFQWTIIVFFLYSIFFKISVNCIL